MLPSCQPRLGQRGLSLGDSPAPCTPSTALLSHHSMALSCPTLLQARVWGVHWGGIGSSPTSIGVLCPWGPLAQHPSSLAG